MFSNQLSDELDIGVCNHPPSIPEFFFHAGTIAKSNLERKFLVRIFYAAGLTRFHAGGA
jgi:hypothetical protein